MIYCGSDSSGDHFDFGYSALSIMFDSNGADMVNATEGYNHFRRSNEFTNRLYTDRIMNLGWNTYYKYIYAANTIVRALTGANETPEVSLYMGYARAARAFGYLGLVQLYAFNYSTIDPASTKAVPIILEDTDAETIANNPRASVADIYARIMSDLDEAIRLLENAEARQSKSFIDLSVAYGIRARANLAMHKYAEAAADAKKARESSSASLLSRADVSVPGFNDDGVRSVMWAALMSEQARAVTTGIVNWPSMLSSFNPQGYTGVGSFRLINKPLYDLIPDSDVRKGWWVNSDVESPLITDMTYGGAPVAEALSLVPYANVKFHAYKNQIGSINASDWIMMRLEEMILIEAEGLAMSGNLAGGKTVLETWLKANRDSNYTSTAATPEDFQNEVWFQRRIELWGEGLSWFDVMRLNKNVVRIPDDQTNTSWLPYLRFNVAAGNPVLLWHIPDDEINGNAAITTAENPTPTIPKAGDGLGLKDGIIAK
jgi:hypothetical protein